MTKSERTTYALIIAAVVISIAPELIALWRLWHGVAYAVVMHGG